MFFTSKTKTCDKNHIVINKGDENVDKEIILGSNVLARHEIKKSEIKQVFKFILNKQLENKLKNARNLHSGSRDRKKKCVPSKERGKKKTSISALPLFHH